MAACTGCQTCNSGTGQGLGRVSMDGNRSPVRRRILTDRIDVASRAVASSGQQVNARLDTIPKKDQQGRIAHLAGFELWGTAQFDTVAATMTGAVSGYQLLGLIRNVFLEDVTAQQFYVNLDGRSVRDDIVMRNYKLLMTDPDDIPDADATNLQINVQWKFSFCRHDEYGPKKDGLIPLTSLTARGDDSFRWNMATGIPGAPAGVTYDGFQGTMRLYANVVYLPELYVGERWSVEEYQMNDTSGSLRHCDRWHEYATIRHFPEDTGGADIDDYAGITFQCNGDILCTAYSATELTQQVLGWVTDDPDSTNDDGDDTSLFVEASSCEFGIITPVMRSNIAGSPFGTLAFTYGTRSTHTTTRYLHRTISKQRPEDVSLIRAAACLPPLSKAVGVVQGDIPVDMASTPNAPVAVYPPTATVGVVKETDVLI